LDEVQNRVEEKVFICAIATHGHLERGLLIVRVLAVCIHTFA
jgi:hypothetical protein